MLIGEAIKTAFYGEGNAIYSKFHNAYHGYPAITA